MLGKIWRTFTMKHLKTILISVAILVITLLIGIDCYKVSQPVKKSLTVPDTGIEIIVKGKYIEDSISTTVNVENGWFKPYIHDIIAAYDLKEFMVVKFVDSDDNELVEIPLAFSDFAKLDGVMIAQKKAKISRKLYKKIDHVLIIYRALNVKEFIR